MKWALHLADVEHEWLQECNPDTLGHPDPAIQQGYWKQFAEHPASIPYRITGV